MFDVEDHGILGFKFLARHNRRPSGFSVHSGGWEEDGIFDNLASPYFGTISWLSRGNPTRALFPIEVSARCISANRAFSRFSFAMINLSAAISGSQMDDPPIYRDHSAPDEDCNCGLHASWQPFDAFDTINHLGLPIVLVVVEGLGRTIVHEKGWRAQRSRILFLCGDLRRDELAWAIHELTEAKVYYGNVFPNPLHDSRYKGTTFNSILERAIISVIDRRPDRIHAIRKETGIPIMDIREAAGLIQVSGEYYRHIDTIGEGINPNGR